MNSLFIDKSDLSHNIRIINSYLKRNSFEEETSPRLIADVSGNGNGLGLLEFSDFLIDKGCDFLAVDSANDALKLRNHGIDKDILITVPIYEENEIIDVIKNNICLTIGSLEMGTMVDNIAASLGLRARAHIALDVGSGRYGFIYKKGYEINQCLKSLKYVDVEGCYTKFYDASNKKSALLQYKRFVKSVDKLYEMGNDLGILHVCDSEAFFLYPQMHLDAVRVGTGFLGRLDLKKDYGLIEIGYFITKVRDISAVPPESNFSFYSEKKKRGIKKVATLSSGFLQGLFMQKNTVQSGFSGRLSEFALSFCRIFKRDCPKILVEDRYGNLHEADVIGDIGSTHLFADVTGKDVVPGGMGIIDVNPLYVNQSIFRNYADSIRKASHGYDNISSHRKRISKPALVAGLLAVLLIVATLVVLPIPKSVARVEAGSKSIDPKSFLLCPNPVNMSFVSVSDDSVKDINLSELSEHSVKIQLMGVNFNSKIAVVDTIAPELTLRDIQIVLNHEPEADEFVESVEDVTEVACEIESDIDTSKTGEFDVNISATDLGGNKTIKSARVSIVEDNEPPVIEGVEDLTVIRGGSISYKKGITVTDNIDKNPTIEIDNSQVDLQTEGEYEVVYVARDESGNETAISAKVTVEKPSEKNITEEVVMKKAQEVLERIVTDDMTPYEKAEKIYWWAHDQIRYVDGTTKEDWIKGAYRGLFLQAGDCYTYFGTSKALLTAAGINNRDIFFERPDRQHYWNLIDVGEGWYHFDTTRRADGKTFFYIKDADIWNYSEANNGSHRYNRDEYTDIQ